MIYDFPDLQRMSNRKRPNAVIRWCEERGILWLPDADGRPTTTSDGLNAAMLRRRKTEPDFTGL